MKTEDAGTVIKTVNRGRTELFVSVAEGGDQPPRSRAV
jgi:hypothetical protein